MDGVPTIWLAEQKKAYPTDGYDIYETDVVRGIWEQYRAATPYPDPRGDRTWSPLLKLDPNRLQHTVNKNESVLIRDKRTGELIGLILRNFTGNNQRLLEWVNGIIAENTGIRRSVRVSSVSDLNLKALLTFCS